MTTRLINGTSDYYFRLSSVNEVLMKFVPRLRPFENEVVSGEMRVQITYEQFSVSFHSNYYLISADTVIYRPNELSPLVILNF